VKLEEELGEMIEGCWTEEICLIQGSETSNARQVKEKFEIMMNEEIGRSVFIKDFLH